MPDPEFKKLLREADRLETAGDPARALEPAVRALDMFPDTHQLRMYVAKLLKLCGREAEAYGHYRRILAAGQADPGLRVNLAEMLAIRTDRAGDPSIEDEILDCFDFDNVELNILARVSAARLVEKYGLRRNPGPPDLDALGADDFMLRVLRRIYFTDRHLERMLRETRRALMLEVVTAGAMRGDRLPLIAAVAMQCALNQYIHDSDAQEEEIVEGFLQLQTALTSGDQPSVGLLGAVLVPAMYMPVEEMPIADKLTALPLDDWPDTVRPLIKSTLLDRYVEKELAADMPSLSPVVDEVSQLVKAQYEVHPYPRWISVSHKAPVGYRDDFQARLPGVEPPAFLDEPGLDVLVAGCGTGRQPISVSKSFRDIRITAVDLSNMSLAYAARMASELGVGNITFVQGDLLDLPRLDTRFGVIYCSGVLHHMDDPVAGWTVLRETARPGGVMNIGLYSERARVAITRAREIIADSGIGDDPASIRKFRRDVFSGRYGDALESLTAMGDFYSLSGCRDLIFNVQEHRYTLPEIDRIRGDLGLEVLGFDSLKPAVRNAYARAYPDDPLMTDLANWDALEEKHPGLFLNMYNIWFRVG